MGGILTDANGKPLYVFGNPGNFTVEFPVDLTMFPPYVVAAAAGPAVGPGVTGAVGTRALADGTFQVTYKGAPLYFCTADTTSSEVCAGIHMHFSATP